MSTRQAEASWRRRWRVTAVCPVGHLRHYCLSSAIVGCSKSSVGDSTGVIWILMGKEEPNTRVNQHVHPFGWCEAPLPSSCSFCCISSRHGEAFLPGGRYLPMVKKYHLRFPEVQPKSAASSAAHGPLVLLTRIMHRTVIKVRKNNLVLKGKQ